MTSPQEPAGTSSTPLHIQVRETIRRQVRDGELIDKTGRLMTEAELGRHFGVSRITIRNAITPLVDEGMFARARGRGTFLRSNQPENWVGRLMGFSETIRDAGYQRRRKDPAAGHDQPPRCRRPRAIARARRLAAQAASPCRRHADRDRARFLSARHRARAREARPHLDHHVQRVRGRARPPHQGSTQTISASLADATSAKLLGVKAGSPLLSIERLTVSTDGRPLELLRSVYLPDYFRLSINLTRRHS